MYGGYKNLFGHDQMIESNMYVYPDHTSPFDGRHPDGTDSWVEFVASQWLDAERPNPTREALGATLGLGSYDAPFCALSAEACVYNATTKLQHMCDASGYGLVYRNNSCIFSGAGTEGSLPSTWARTPAFSFSACQLRNLSDPPTMITADNRYFTDLVNNSHELTIGCGDDDVPLSVWQRKYGQDLGSTLQPAPSVDGIVAMAQRKLGLRVKHDDPEAASKTDDHPPSPHLVASNNSAARCAQIRHRIPCGASGKWFSSAPGGPTDSAACIQR